MTPQRTLLVTFIAVILAGAALIVTTRTSLFKTDGTLTDYIDSSYRIYKCDEPIKAKKGTVYSRTEGPHAGLVPADQNEFEATCRQVGID